MKIGFYDPYLDSLGGGERYALTLASHWSGEHQVALFWDDISLREQATSRFNLDLARIQLVPNIFLGRSLITKLWITRDYDLIFFVSDGSVPMSLAKYNILHFQVPFPRVKTNLLKLSRFQAIVCNSEFTKNNLDLRLKGKTTVIYPPVKSIPPNPKVKKEKLILSVGRFTGYHHAKKQEILIDAFKKLSTRLPGWKLVLAGGLMPDDRDHFRRLKELSKGYRISFVVNLSYSELVKLNQQAAIYWHAAGFGEIDPRFREHFGISTVEAMSSGAVPIVFAGGGQTEIVKDCVNGYLWSSVPELIGRTEALIQAEADFGRLSRSAIERASDFSENRFTAAFDNLLPG